jgi:hypothetical protein
MLLRVFAYIDVPLCRKLLLPNSVLQPVGRGLMYDGTQVLIKIIYTAIHEMFNTLWELILACFVVQTVFYRSSA